MARKKPLIQFKFLKNNRKIKQITPTNYLSKENFKELLKIYFRDLVSTGQYTCLAVFDMDSLKLKGGQYVGAETIIASQEGQTSTIYFFVDSMYRRFLEGKSTTLFTPEVGKELKAYLQKIISAQLFTLAAPAQPYAN